MKVTGTYTFEASQQAVWDTLQSPEVLASCIPGCDRFEPEGEGQYDVAMQVGIGPIRGAYTAKISLTEQKAPDFYRMAVKGSGSGGTFNGEGSVTLSEENGTTSVAVDGDVHVTGVVARVGQRLMGSAAKTMLERFFSCMGSKIVS
ncbi:MAG: carbon monoxide dehydrogenase subunit G [Chloroflexi bacterium]|nr:carbon monoxide dehydrogenase subunit G [Chloroflexota bacterium]